MPQPERNTAQRQAISRVFLDAGRPLNPREVAQAAAARVPGLSIATVYRNIRGLLESGWLSPVQIPGEPPRYELCGKGHHHYFRCRACEQIYNIDACPGDLQPLAPKGFRVEDHSLVLFGVCSDCGKPAGRPSRHSRRGRA